MDNNNFKPGSNTPGTSSQFVLLMCADPDEELHVSLDVPFPAMLCFLSWHQLHKQLTRKSE